MSDDEYDDYGDDFEDDFEKESDEQQQQPAAEEEREVQPVSTAAVAEQREDEPEDAPDEPQAAVEPQGPPSPLLPSIVIQDESSPKRRPEIDEPATERPAVSKTAAGDENIEKLKAANGALRKQLEIVTHALEARIDSHSPGVPQQIHKKVKQYRKANAKLKNQLHQANVSDHRVLQLEAEVKDAKTRISFLLEENRSLSNIQRSQVKHLKRAEANSGDNQRRAMQDELRQAKAHLRQVKHTSEEQEHKILSQHDEMRKLQQKIKVYQAADKSNRLPTDERAEMQAKCDEAVKSLQKKIKLLEHTHTQREKQLEKRLRAQKKELSGQAGMLKLVQEQLKEKDLSIRNQMMQVRQLSQSLKKLARSDAGKVPWGELPAFALAQTLGEEPGTGATESATSRSDAHANGKRVPAPPENDCATSASARHYSGNRSGQHRSVGKASPGKGKSRSKMRQEMERRQAEMHAHLHESEGEDDADDVYSEAAISVDDAELEGGESELELAARGEKERVEREAKEGEEQKKREREERERAEKEAQKNAEQECREREEAERLERETKQKAEQEAKEKAEQEAREQAEREAKEKAEQEAREQAEREAKEKAEQEAREQAEREAREAAEKEEAERQAKEAAERAAKEQAEREEAERKRPKTLKVTIGTTIITKCTGKLQQVSAEVRLGSTDAKTKISPQRAFGTKVGFKSVGVELLVANEVASARPDVEVEFYNKKGFLESSVGKVTLTASEWSKATEAEAEPAEFEVKNYRDEKCGKATLGLHWEGEVFQPLAEAEELVEELE